MVPVRLSQGILPVVLTGCNGSMTVFKPSIGRHNCEHITRDRCRIQQLELISLIPDQTDERCFASLLVSRFFMV
ncbi:hypothetical protein VTN96DRAFT_9888 [Rasamsonia emersonii]